MKRLQNFTGQAFDCYTVQCHHFLFQNLEFTHLADSTVYPGGQPDPPVYGPYFRFTPTVPWSGTQGSDTPDYNVIDRVYLHSPTGCSGYSSAGGACAARELMALSSGGNHFAAINSYVQAEYFTPGVFPTSGPTTVGAVVTIPQSQYQYNALDGVVRGMSSSASATFTVPSGYTGAFFGWLTTSGLTVNFQTASGASLVCTGCTGAQEASPTRNTVPASAFWLFSGAFDGSGNASISASMPANTIPGGYAFKPLGIFINPGNFGYYDNLFISAIGQTVYNDAGGADTDETWTHNYIYFPRSKMKNSGSWDGYGYSFRNVFERKQLNRLRYSGNISDGSASFQNPGNVFYVAGSFGTLANTGTSDWLVTNNVFKHLSAGVQIAGGGSATPPDTPAATRLEFANNLFLDLNRNLYNNGGGGFVSGAFGMYPNANDVDIHNNTVGLTQGSGPVLLAMGAASQTNTIGLADGLQITNNLMQVFKGPAGGITGFTSACGNYINYAASQYAANPPVTCPTSPTYAQMFGTWFVRSPGAFTGNILVGGLSESDGAGTPYVDTLTQSGFASIMTGLPTGNTLAVGGDTYAARLAAMNWVTLANGFPSLAPSTYNPGGAGADINAIYQATGTVTGISTRSTGTTAAITYTAPDARVVYADISSDGGATWTRGNDGGGYPLARSVLFTGLTASTTYTYRLMAYFDQCAAFTASCRTEEFLLDQITSGTVTTPAMSTRTVSILFSLAAFSGSTAFSAGLSAPDGTLYHNDACTVSPCTLATVPIGRYTLLTRWLIGATVIGSNNSQNVIDVQ